jgi:sortase B
MRMKAKKILLGVLFLAALAVFCVALYNITATLREERACSQLNETLIEQAVVIHLPDAAPTADSDATQEEQPDSEQTEPSETPQPPIAVDFEQLWQQNSDIVAWIYCPDTPINYPIVQTDNNSDYLRRLLDGSYNTAGTLFLDYRCAADFSDWNSIVYGHNMKNDSMFGTLVDYGEQAYFDAHPLLYLATPEQTYTVSLFAGYVTGTDDMVYLLDAQTRDDLIDNVLLRSDFSSPVRPTEDDRILTLSTCSYEYEDARYVLFGIVRAWNAEF